MSKMVLFFSLLSLSILLFFGIVNPDSPVMWMASTSEAYSYLRIALIAVLAGLMITNPPRNVSFRTFVGIVSVMITSWSLNATYNNEMALLDTLALLQFSISAGLIVLERDYDEVAEKVQKHTKSAKSKKRAAKQTLATA
jgi:hypothetical protein